MSIPPSDSQSQLLSPTPADGKDRPVEDIPTEVLRSSAGREGIEVLVGRLVEDMVARWKHGERPLAEEYLDCHPEVLDYPEVAAQIIYEEVCLRQEYGQEVPPDIYLRRFPQWRAQLEVLLGCHRLLQPSVAGPVAPPTADVFGSFCLLAELGHGAQGRVYLATQSYLEDRPVVLKVTGCRGREHLALARLQHTHIMPLYWAQDLPDRDQRVLCMPYLGGATLTRLLEELRPIAPGRRTGKDLLEALDRAQARAPVSVPSRGPARLMLERVTFARAVCWVGVCLADALHYAHQRGLVHLDVKPSNVLIASDGQPYLLDFHLTQEPIRPGAPNTESVGGTPAYMSPEHHEALTAVREGRPVPGAVDSRSDIYSLGLLLYEALGGTYREDGRPDPGRLRRDNPQVSPGLADILARCLAPDPAHRYRSASDLAADLRRHLDHRPLAGVPNRSWAERWRKWRRRRPYALPLTVMAAAVLAAAAGAGLIALDHWRRPRREAEAALAAGKEFLDQRDYVRAADALGHGLALAESHPVSDDLKQELAGRLRLARRARAAQGLTALADRVRYLYGADALPSRVPPALEVRWRSVWDQRDQLLKRDGADLGQDIEERIATDLRDLGVIWADLRGRLAAGPQADEARREALRVLDQTEALFGPSPVLYRQREGLARALGQTARAGEAARQAAGLAPRTAWEHYALGRSLLRSGDLDRAAAALGQALDLRPQDFWTNFYQGVCACRRRQYTEAVGAFRVCVALAPDSAPSYCNRGLAHAALGQTEQALHDYSRALRLDPELTSAALNRGILHYQARRFEEAAADLRRALDGGEPAAHYHLALVRLAQHNRAAALDHVRSALQADPGHAGARALRKQLQGSP
jgi:tetratricopeptide (TPR) repeat protein